MQSPHSDEEDEDYVMEQDPDYARLVAEDHADVSHSGVGISGAGNSKKRSAVSQAVADAKRRKRARQTAENVEVAWLEMNSQQPSSSATSEEILDQSSPSSTNNKLNVKATNGPRKHSYQGLNVQQMLALAAKKGKNKKKKKTKKKVGKVSKKDALLKKILRGTPSAAASDNKAGVHLSDRLSGKAGGKATSKRAGPSSEALLAARKALGATRKKTVTETVRFGNEISQVERVVSSTSSSSASTNLVASGSAPATNPLEKLVAGLNGPQTVSTMQKTSLEWETFKSKQGIGDELERYTKNGYLAKQDFLGRVDLLQFEKEKAEREKIRRYEESKKGKSK